MTSEEQPIEINKENEPDHPEEPKASPPPDVPETPVDDDLEFLDAIKPRGKAKPSVGGGG
ncbi:hypothetical protein BOTBODRAFT_27447 [Botryobasidium botryosum FD-172 SS1]|uniref:Uncharacterized protein n=1 Tax=Botryobasidium botryosum (strain FD-172 SS1) TaxID=930990 RepID=A0A067N8C3_BOTB1|nr:hypothetical protein BOTBODRAFT_27447 [Botryobasidium botryosum FD-172 SS1]